MSNAAKTGLALVIITAVIVVGLIWYMGSPSASSGGLAAARSLGQPISSNGSTVTAGDTSDAAIRSDLSAVDASMSALGSDAKDMDSFSL